MPEINLQTRIRQGPRVTRQDILEGLHGLGLHRGDRIMVHSSLSSFGYVEPTDKPTDRAIIHAISKDLAKREVTKERVARKVTGANTVIDALLDCVGDNGVLMMPSFNHGRANVYDPATTPTTNGIIPDVFWRMPEVKRSLHPTHPYAALGQNADQLLEGNTEASTFGKDCPLGRLIYDNGYILLLGVGLRSSTAMHVAETIARVQCMGYREELGKVLKDGKVIYVPMDIFRGGECYLEKHVLEPRMRRAGMIKDTTVGAADLHLIRGLDLLNTVLAIAKEYCLVRCPVKPRYERATKRLREEILYLQDEGRIR